MPFDLFWAATVRRREPPERLRGGRSRPRVEGPPAIEKDGKTIGNGSTRNAVADVIAERLVLGEEFENAREARTFLNTVEGSICVVLFEADVDDAKFYDVEVGGRGNVTFSWSDLEKQDWYVALTLGA